MGMDAGRLDRRVRLERASRQQSETSGEMVETWLPIATVWASRRDVSDAERVAASQVAATISTRFQIRWAPGWADLNPKDRLVSDGRTYDIVAVKEIGRREGLEISALARADQ